MSSKKLIPIGIGALVLLGCLLLMYQRTGPAADLPVSSSITVDDFRITLTSQCREYRRSSMDPEAPLDVVAELEYIGNSPKIEIWHGAPDVFEIYLVSAQEAVWGDNVYIADLGHTLFSPGHVEQTAFTGKSEYGLSGAPSKGPYSVWAYVEFWLDEECRQEISCTLEIPVSII